MIGRYPLNVIRLSFDSVKLSERFSKTNKESQNHFDARC